MQYTRLGRTGLTVSRICFGAMSFGAKSWRPWVLEEEDARSFYEKAWELGINFYDTADVYSDGVSEEITGRMLRGIADDREDYVIATKFFLGTQSTGVGLAPRGAPKIGRINRSGASRKHIIAACEASLKRLGMDYIDLYQIHRYDYRTPYEETMEALHYLVSTGKVRYVGASSMQAWRFARFLYKADAHRQVRFVSMQNHYNLLYREEEREMVPLCLQEGVGMIPWSPLARGQLSGNRFAKRQGDNQPTTRGDTDEMSVSLYSKDRDEAVAQRNLEVAERLGETPAKVAMAWLLSRPAVTAPIVGVTKMHHLEEAVAAVDLKLSDNDIKALEEPYKPHPVLGFV